MRKEPFITVFTPNFNGSRYISETIESVLNQTYSNFEYIIVDDCSTDNSWQIIQEYAKKDNRIKPYKNKKNLHIVKTRNRGFKLSSSNAKYFAIIDSDDVALPYRFKVQVEFLEKNPDFGLVGSDTIIINENSQIIGFRKYPSTNNEIRKVITRINPIAQSSVTLRKKAIEEVGMYDLNWKVAQDYDYWLRVGILWKIGNIKRPLIKYRLSKTQIKKTHLKENIQNSFKIQKKALTVYGYKDRLYNKFFRILMRIISIFPKFIYFLYEIKIRIFR